MPPKKQQQKMSLNEFLGDANFGSWADEMEDFPTAPAPRLDESRGTALSRAPDRGERSFSAREELPLPTQPPYTAFVGNLTFDITERELGDHFKPSEVKTVKIIKDREDKPKGFGYVEFVTLDGLKSALEKSNSTLAGRTIRVSVADPPKEREGRPFGDRGGSSADDDRQWRREGPLPSHDDKRGGFGGGGRNNNRYGERDDGERERDRDRDRGDRMGFGSKFQSHAAPPSIAEETSDWRSTMKSTAPPTPQHPEKSSRFGFGERFSGEGSKRRGSGVSTGGYESPKVGPADIEEKWTIGSRLKPSQSSPERQQEGGAPGRKFGHGRADPDVSDEVQDWRSTPRKVAVGLPTGGAGRGSAPERTPSTSGPPTRRKLELLPRTNAELTTPGSPRSAEATPASATSAKPNPFGAARPVDVAAREREIEEKMEKARLASTPLQSTASLGSRPSSRPTSRTGSRAGSPTRSPRTTGLGLGGMTNTPATPSTPKILTRPMGSGPPNRSGNHGRTSSFNTRGVESGGEWRRNAAPPPVSSTSTGTSSADSPAPAPIVTASERRASIVRPSVSFASAAGGSKLATSASMKGNPSENTNEPASVES